MKFDLQERLTTEATEVAEFGVLLHKIIFSAYSASPRWILSWTEILWYEGHEGFRKQNSKLRVLRVLRGETIFCFRCGAPAL